MIAVFFLAAGVLWTHAPGWTDPFEVIETPNNNPQVKDLLVTSLNHLHQAWSKYGGESRVGYNLILPDGTILVPDQMISNDVQAAYPRMARLGEDSVVIVWQESYQFMLQVRDHDGQVITPTTAIPIPPASWIWFSVACDSLRRIHLTSAHLESPGVGFVLYSVHAIDGSVLFTDSIPGSYYWPEMYIDGSRVHIKYESPDPWDTMYIQYDLDGNINVAPVFLFNDARTSHYTSVTSDAQGDAYIAFMKVPVGADPPLLALYKINAVTGEILINGQVIFQGPFNSSVLNDLPAIEPMPGKTSFYLSWLQEVYGQSLKLDFCIIDMDGNFIEEPYTAYDYTDEPIQNLQNLSSTVNTEGDLFLTWCEGDTLVWGYYIVLGWLDYNWVGIEDDPVVPDQSSISMSISSNPFNDFLSIEISGAPEMPGLSVYDITGRLRQELSCIPAGNHYTSTWIPEQDIPDGCYLVVLEAGDERVVRMCIKLD